VYLLEAGFALLEKEWFPNSRSAFISKQSSCIKREWVSHLQRLPYRSRVAADGDVKEGFHVLKRYVYRF